MTRSLLFGVAWSLGLLFCFLTLPRLIPLQRTEHPPKTIKRGWLILVLVACLVRLVPNLILPVGAVYDIESYQIVADTVLQGQDVYTADGRPSASVEARHPYLPFQMYWMAFARWSSNEFQVPYVKVVRLLPIVADIGIVLLIYHWRSRDRRSRRLLQDQAFFSGMLYALNPVAVFVCAYHGQFDAIPLLCLVCAIIFLERSPGLSGMWLGIGILDKSWPVLALPSLLWGVRTSHPTPSWKKILVMALVSVAIPLLGTGLYTVLFRADFFQVIGRALGYNRGIGAWGYSYFFRLLASFYPAAQPAMDAMLSFGRTLTLLALGLIWFFGARKQSPSAGILTILVAYLVFTHAFSIQYLLWVIPFAVLEGEYSWLKRFTLAAFCHMVLTYFTLIMARVITNVVPMPQADLYLITSSSLLPWFVAIGWLVARARAIQSCPFLKVGGVLYRQ